MDHLGIITQTQEQLNSIKSQLRSEFKTVEMGKLSYILDIRINWEEDNVFFLQDRFINDALQKFGLMEIKEKQSPMVARHTLVKAKNNDVLVDNNLYCQLISTLVYCPFYLFLT